MKNHDRGRVLIISGVLLFFAGLLSGIAIPHLKNPRMGMAAHMEAIMNGIFLIVAGGILWERINLTEKLTKITEWLLIYSGYSNLFFLMLAGFWGTSKMTPIAGAGYSAPPWQEAIVSAGLVSIVLTVLAATVIIIKGLLSDESESLK